MKKIYQIILFDIIRVFFVISTLLKNVDSSTCIVTKHNNSRQKKPCVFPFTFTDKGRKETHNICTNRLDPNGRFWCSTKVKRVKTEVFFDKTLA